jgi:hypothetical protein
MEDEAISKSALAKLLGCSPGAITKVCQRGAPVRGDGKLDQVEFLEFLTHSTSGHGGGWGGARGRPDLAERAQCLLDGKAPPEAEPDAHESDAGGTAPEEDVLVLNETEFRKLHGEICEKAFRDGVFHAMNQYRRPGNVLEIADLALKFGCTPSVAYAIAQGYDLLLVLWTVEEKDGPVVEYGDEPDWKGWARRAGVDGDIEAWDREAKRLFNHWVKGPSEPSGKAVAKKRKPRPAK